MDRVYAACTLDSHELRNLVIDSLLSLNELRSLSAETWNLNLVGKIVLYCIRKNEVTVGKTLHKSRSTKTVSTMIAEVSLTDSEETWD